MDWISELPEAVLLRILSLLPTAKDVVGTMVLSKRWQFLWMYVPRLVYDDRCQNLRGTFARFVDRSLIMHEAPVLDTLHFKLYNSGAGDIKVWIRAASKCSVRELILEIERSSKTSPIILPRSLYEDCKMLVMLKLTSVILVDGSSSISFPSLKTLSLLSVTYPGDEFVKKFLSSCHVLDDLHVEQCRDDNVTIFTVIVPSLKRLVLRTLDKKDRNDDVGYVIDAPSLKYLDIRDHKGSFCLIENEMPNIVQANVDVLYSHPGKILSSITSVEHLYLCLSTSKNVYPVGSVFSSLEQLKICTCETEWLNLFMCVLKDSPKLRGLKLNQFHSLRDSEPRPCWKEPSSVPECLLSSLETLEWVKYEGTEEEKEVVAFILRSGSCLKNVTISSKTTDPNKKLEMLKQLSLSFRRSPTCALAFD